MNNYFDGLFLLELVIDNISIVKSNNNNRSNKFCISFEFFKHAVEVIENECDDFVDRNKNKKCGIDCLFSMTSDIIKNEIGVFEIKVNCYTEENKGSSEKNEIASSVVSIADLYSSVVARVTEGAECPVLRSTNHSVVMSNSRGENIGRVLLFVRLSFIGNNIIVSKVARCTKRILLEGSSERTALTLRECKNPQKGILKSGLLQRNHQHQTGSIVTRDRHEDCQEHNEIYSCFKYKLNINKPPISKATMTPSEYKMACFRAVLDDFSATSLDADY